MLAGRWGEVMTTIGVASVADLKTALSSAHAGDIIALAPGVYSNVSIYNIHFSSPVTITSKDPAHPATILGLTVNQSSGLYLAHLQIGPVSATPSWAASVANSSNIAFSKIDFAGSTAVLPSAGPSGLLVQSSSVVAIQNSYFHDLNTGISEIGNHGVVISGNAFDHIGTDGVDNGGSSYVTIKNNNFTEFENTVGTLHPDAIQFWTTNTTASAHDIAVTGNVFDRGAGSAVEGIFMHDGSGALPFKNITISDNLILGSQWNGICLDDAGSVTVTNNTVATWAGQNTNTGALVPNLTARILLDSKPGSAVNESGNLSQGYLLADFPVAPPPGNQSIGAVLDGGASLLLNWSQAHPAQVSNYSADLISLLTAAQASAANALLPQSISQTHVSEAVSHAPTAPLLETSNDTLSVLGLAQTHQIGAWG